MISKLGLLTLLLIASSSLGQELQQEDLEGKNVQKMTVEGGETDGSDEEVQEVKIQEGQEGKKEEKEKEEIDGLKESDRQLEQLNLRLPEKFRHGDILTKDNKAYRVEYRLDPNATDTHGHKPHEHASVVLSMLFGCMLVAQILLYVWKKYHYRSFQSTTLFGLWIIPMAFSSMYVYWRMMTVWIGFTAASFAVMKKASQKPLERNTPRQVYGWFFFIYKFCYGLAVVGYIMCVMEFVGVFHMFDYHLLPMATLLIFYGLYFGVLGRDCAELCADRMASSMGYYGGKDGFPRTQIRPNICAICNQDLLPPARVDRPNKTNSSEKVFTLSCRHQFHEFCVRGWTLIGKKDTCPHCSEKVSLKQTFRNPWDNPSIAWAHVLDALRYLIVWNPVIIVIAQTSLLHMGYGPDDEMPTLQPTLVPIRHY